jgi:quinone-modifying oxidoreductase, subunit QmoC
MATRIETGMLREMKTYGAFDVNACFNCGNCTAVCPLSQGSVAFPRRMIRYAQLGQRDHVAASRELWLCYNCTECSDTCPRQAGPGEFMAAARRFATASFDPTTFSRRLHRSTAFAWTALAVLFAVLVGLLLADSSSLPTGDLTSESLLRFVPFEAIHWLGIGVVAIAAIAALATVVNMLWMIARTPAPGAPLPRAHPERFPLSDAVRALGTTLAEVFGQSRYRDCDKEKPAPSAPLPLRRWFVHYCIMLGMIGLAAATALDYLFKTPGSYVPIWYPMRLLGTIAGIALVYGASAAFIQRLRKPENDKYYARTMLSDWLLLGFLWAIGVTGFVLEIADYASLGHAWIAVVFICHVALAMEFILLLPFTKLAHIFYRPLAIWFTEFRRLRATSD